MGSVELPKDCHLSSEKQQAKKWPGGPQHMVAYLDLYRD